MVNLSSRLIESDNSRTVLRGSPTSFYPFKGEVSIVEGFLGGAGRAAFSQLSGF